MKQTRLLMGMPITVEILDSGVSAENFDAVYGYFQHIDSVFSTYKPDSEISKINAGRISPENYSKEMSEVFELAARTKEETRGYFDIYHNNKCDPSGLVKGWAIKNAAEILRRAGWHDFFVDAGGDIQVYGRNAQKEKWRIGIRNPFNQDEIVKVVALEDGEGMATSGNYIRGEHIYNPHISEQTKSVLASITVIGPNVYEADRFATAAYAMGEKGIEFIASLSGLEGYAINNEGIATFTSGFEKYVP